MSDKNFDDFLTKTLQGSSQYLDDAGFAFKVIQNLPEKSRKQRMLEKLILALPVSVVAVLVLSQLPWNQVVHPIYAQLITLGTTHLVASVTAFLLLAVALPAVWVLRKTSLI